MIDVSSIIGFGKIVMINENETVFEEGAPSSNDIYVVFSGKVAQYSKQIQPGKDIKIYEFKAGSTMGAAAAISQKPYTYTAKAVEKSALILLTPEKFNEVCEKIPQFAKTVIEDLSGQLNRLYFKEIKLDPPKPVETPQIQAKKIEVNNEAAELFPLGIKLYNITEPETYKNYIYDYEISCPVCKNLIHTKTQLTSRLKLINTDYDLHKHYENFEPVWYNIWTCPSCYYSNLYYDFEDSLGTMNEQELIGKLEKVKKQVKLNFTYPKNVDEAISSYYIAIYCAEFYDAPYLKFAKLWLQLSWLYKNIEDDDMHMKAAQKALDYYNKMYYNSHEKLDPVHEQACLIVMAELFILFDDLDRALTFLVNARKFEGGNRYYALRAERRADDVREMRRGNRYKQQS